MGSPKSPASEWGFCLSASKRTLAIREFSLGTEAMTRFVSRQALRQVDEYAFGILALEREPVSVRAEHLDKLTCFSLDCSLCYSGTPAEDSAYSHMTEMFRLGTEPIWKGA